MKDFFKQTVISILTWEAKRVLRKYKPQIVAVTGNVGKTSTKDAIYTVLAEKYYVRKSEKSYNTEFGVPLTILGVPNAWNNPFLWLKNIVEGFLLIALKNHYPRWLVLEVGADHPDDIKKIARWLAPDVVVLTRLPDVPVHIEFFESAEAIADEKWHLVEALKPNGLVVYNADDVNIADRMKGFTGQSLGYGTIPGAQVEGGQDEILYAGVVPDGIRFRLSYGGRSVPIQLHGAIGRQLIYTALAAASVGLSQEMNLIAVAEALGKYQPPNGRMRILPGVKHTTIIDDSYNSSPVAAHEALITLGELEVKGKKIAVLGDMLELGTQSIEEHRKVGELAAKNADMLVTVGVRARGIAESARSHGMPDLQVFQYEDARQAGMELEQELEEGDIVLIKGSQSMRMERAVEEIMAEPLRKGELLVRQDAAWLRR